MAAIVLIVGFSSPAAARLLMDTELVAPLQIFALDRPEEGAANSIVMGNTCSRCARLAQANRPSSAQHQMRLGREFKLRNGESARVGDEGLEVRFERVTVDARCPVGDPCVAGPGDAVVLVTLEQPSHPPTALQLHTTPGSTQEGRYLNYGVRLVRLEPRPVGEQQVPLAQYWATFTISR